ncbi:MAG: hypothetical protein AB1444_01700 [Spirochaetota bacterium]
MKNIMYIIILIFMTSTLYSQKHFLKQEYSNTNTKGNIIFGLVTKKNDTYYITHNWRSRSLVTYKIEGNTAELEKFVNKPVLAKGKITQSNEIPRNRFILESVTKSWESGKSISLKGHVKKGKNHIYFIEYPLPNERFMYIVTSDKTNSIEKFNTKFITVKGIIKAENNWNKIFLEIEEIEEK